MKINFSSLNLIHECLRKADYVLNRNLKKEDESSALTFGTAIHKALETWYGLPVKERALDASADTKRDIEMLSAGYTLDASRTGALEAIRQFVISASSLRSLDDGDKRSIENGIKILQAYFKQWADDKLEVVRDAEGKPMTELFLESVLLDTPALQITFFGTIDAILRHTETSHTFIADHKTTSALGTPFFNRIKPNHQYTGYLWLARQNKIVDTNLFLVNGVQVAKTKCEFARQVTERDESDYEEFKEVVIQGVETYLRALQASSFPMYAPNPCSNYGACQFLDVCSSPKQLRENILQAKFGGDKL